MRRYAEDTGVASHQTRSQIEQYVSKQGAVRFAFGYLEDRAAVSFVAKGTTVRFTIPMATEKDIREQLQRRSIQQRRNPELARRLVEQEDRRRWRCLYLAIKAKFTTVASGIETFEQAFLANVVTTDNLTVWEALRSSESGIKLLPPREGKS